MSEQQDQKSIGKFMFFAMWIVLLGLLAMMFNNLLERQYNPNQQLVSQQTDQGDIEVVLQRNKFGHYVSSGTINSQPVVFMLDTGATDISVPETVAKRLRLKAGTPSIYQTANGNITVYKTILEQVNLGGIQLNEVRASINPHMSNEEILLGMSFLKHLEFAQKGDTLTLRQRFSPN
ncbi:MAG: TIGR02281 family clan AA aspartic protease [Gammaproteobacteria bacterium]|nr:TIGR02281 family clan AA aspartic protease [Gammaproteobacteria bacterium]